MLDLDTLDTLRRMCESVDPLQQESAEQPVQLDPEKYKAYAKSPSDIPEETLRDIAAVIDGKLNVNPPDDTQLSTVPVAAPSTLDRLLNSIVIVYITDNDIPIAAASIIDPTVESWRGFVPLSYYSIESGYNLDGRVQQEFFAVADEYRGKGIGRELKAQIAALGTPTFILVDRDDAESVRGVAENGYTLVCEMNDVDSDQRVLLWIDNPPDDGLRDADADMQNDVV